MFWFSACFEHKFNPCCVTSGQNFNSLPQDVSIVTDPHISLSYTIHEDITLAVVQTLDLRLCLPGRLKLMEERREADGQEVGMDCST